MNTDVPYTLDGVIEGGELEDSLPEPEDDDGFDIEIAALDFSKPLPSNLHPYYHWHPDSDCCMVAHKCNCDKCRETETVLASPARKRSACIVPFDKSEGWVSALV